VAGIDSAALIEGTDHVFGLPEGRAGRVARRYEAHSFSGLPPGLHRGLPSHALTFRVSLAEPTDITSMPNQGQSSGKYYAFVGGLHSAPALIAHSGSGCGIGIDVSPLACREFFGVPAGSLASVVVALDDLVGTRVTTELCDRLHSAPTWPGRFRVLDSVVARIASAHEPRPPAPEVVEAWRCIVASRGRTSVEALAVHVGWSRRHLTSQFNIEIGLSPKIAMRVVRFQVASELLLARSDLSRTEIAARTGFYDQSHLNREGSVLAGCTPSAWLVEEFHDPPRLDREFPFVQDTERPVV
jgi:AraC-like DNA-binding protein